MEFNTCKSILKSKEIEKEKLKFVKTDRCKYPDRRDFFVYGH